MDLFEKDLFYICKKQQTYSNFNSEEWKTMRFLADDRNVIIKKPLNDKNVYKEVNFNEKLIQDLYVY